MASDLDPENMIGSRYTIVIAAAKRARQLVDHAEPMTIHTKVDRPVSIAVHELKEGKIKIIQNEPTEKTEEIIEEDAVLQDGSES